MEKRSTVINLVRVSQYIPEALDCQRQLNVIYTVFEKGLIEHYLLSKLESIGISGVLSLLLKYSFVKNNTVC